MTDIYLDTITHDLYIDAASLDLQLVTGVDAVVQALKIRLAFIFQEWYLDGVQGVRYFDYMQQKNPDIGLVDSVIKTTIIETPDVLELLAYRSEYSAAQRRMSVTFEVNTVFGTTTLTQGL